MSLSAVIKDISENWLDYRNHCLDKSKTGAVIRKVKEDHKIYDLVTSNWKDLISENVNEKKYLVDSSLGKGLLSAAPWLTVMDRSVTDSATEGFYVVYLFSRSAKKLYLAIGIGATQFQDIYGMTKLALEKIDEANKKFFELFKKYDTSFNSIKPKCEIYKFIKSTNV